MYSWVKTVFYTLDIVALLGMAVYIYLLIQRNKADAAKWKRLSEQRYKEGRSEASEILREAVDQIADDKNRLAAMSDRELLTEAVMGLGGLGRRMDRIEDSMRAFGQFEKLLDSISEQTEEISEHAKRLNVEVLQAKDNTAAFCATVADTEEAVYSLSDASGHVDQLLQQIAGQMNGLSGIAASFTELQGQMHEAVLHMNQMLRLSMDNPAAVLGKMDSRISTVHEQLQNLSEGLNLMAESLEGVQETLGTVSDRINSVSEPIEK